MTNIQAYVYIVDDDYAVRDGLGMVMEVAGLRYQVFESAEHFLESADVRQPGCVVLDFNMPGLNGLQLQAEMQRRDIPLPIIFLTAHGDIPMTVTAMKAGAVDFITKPASRTLLLERVQAVLGQEIQLYKQGLSHTRRCNAIKDMTSRQLEIIPLMVAGRSNKEIARELDISFRTMEVHRARILKRAGVITILELGHLWEAYQLWSKSQDAG